LIFPPLTHRKGRMMDAYGSALRFPYQDPALPVPQRVEDLLGRMSVEDKAGMMFYAHAIVGDMSCREDLGQWALLK
jgi:hypothetical protein